MRRHARAFAAALPLLLAVCALEARADPSGKKWQVPGPIPYTVFNHPSINCASTPCNFATDVVPAVNRGFEHWTKGALGAVCPGGTTPSWDSTYSGTFTTPSGSSAINGSDGVNRVIWLGGAEWTYGAQTLGLTITQSYVSTGQIIDADLQLNNDVSWKVGGPAGYQVDVESIVTHEAGHFLGLNHSTPTSAVMYAYYDTAAGEIKRTLSSNDLDDVCTVYPGPAASGLNQGDPCAQDSQCDPTKSLKCRASSPGGSKICTTECSTNAQCASGYTCQTSSPGGSTGKACLPPVGATDLCKFCTAGSQCSSGQCVTNGPQNWCTRTCMSAADCGPGFDCVTGTTSMVCVPTGNACPTAQCTANKDCPVGYACSGGMCMATGNPGDRCEISIYCQQCSTCVLDGAGPYAYCRSCCGGAEGTADCQSCSNTACPSGLGCYGLTGSTDQVCYPESGITGCEACDAATPCQAGYSCSFGRCHPACNPASPGSCSACADLGGSQGACACPGEIAYAGSPCGSGTQGLAICVQGTACVGDPKTCRTRCTLSSPDSCQSGESCQSVDGTAVCVPTNVPGQRCSACENGGCDVGFQCVGGRCYQPCNVEAPGCSSCVEAAPGVGICACDDQLSNPGEACGAIGAEVHACARSSLCVSGVCRLKCDPAAPQCAYGEYCLQQAWAAFCQPGMPEPEDAGTTTPAGRPDAGAQKPAVTSGGCGCSAGSPGPGLWLAGALLGWATLRRSFARARRGFLR